MLARRVGPRDFDVWPSYKKMADDAEMSISSARRFILELEAARFIVLIPQERKDGGRTSNIYRLQVRSTMSFPDGSTRETMPDSVDEDTGLDDDTPMSNLNTPPAAGEQGPLFTAEQGYNELNSEGTKKEDSPPLLTERHSPEENLLFEEERESNDLPMEIPKLEDQVVNRWHWLKAAHPHVVDVQRLNDSRRKKITARAKEVQQPGQSLWEVWQVIFDRIEANTFLCGEDPPGRGYTSPKALDIDFVLRPSEFLKIFEGGYRANRSASTHDPVTGRRFGPAEQSGRQALERFLSGFEEPDERRDPRPGQAIAHRHGDPRDIAGP